MREIESLRIVVFRERECWLAQALERDIGVQAGDLGDLLVRLTLALERELCLPTFVDLAPAPKYFQDLWPARSGMLLPVDESALLSMGIRVQLAMVA